jgi:hypothetical protein
MSRILRLIPLLIFCLPSHAVESDQRLVERLEAAEDSREQHDILDEIVRRATDASFQADLTDRLITELMTKESYGYHHIMRELPQLGGDRGFSERSLVTLASALSGGMTRHYDAAWGIATALSGTHAKTGLPDAAFRELVAALGHIAMLNRWAAIEVLSVTRSNDGRYEDAMAAILHALSASDHAHTRSSAVLGLGELIGDRSLPPEAVQRLTVTATADQYITVRMDAFELLASRRLDEDLLESLTACMTGRLPFSPPCTSRHTRIT